MADVRIGAHRVPALIVRGDSTESRPDAVAGEEPLQIRACGPGQDPQDIVVTMRTPGQEAELAMGFLLAEGLIEADDAPAAEFTFGHPVLMAQPHNEILVTLPRPIDLSAVRERHFMATASCGICGRASIDELVARIPRIEAGTTVGRPALARLPDAMRAAQAIFEDTGGLHAAALFRPDGGLVELREDIGRHNAVDKLVGARALAGALPADDSMILVSGRASFEIVQKVALARVPILCAVSAPSDLAVSTAERLGLTLVGFLRGSGFNVYTGAQRIDFRA